MKRTNTFFLTFAFGITSMLTTILCACGGGGSETPNAIIPQIPEVKRDIPCELMTSNGAWAWNKERSRATAHTPAAGDLLLPYETSTGNSETKQPAQELNGWMHIGSNWIGVPFTYISGTHPDEFHYYAVAKDQSGTCDKVFIYDARAGFSPSLSGTTFTLTGLSDITTLDDDIRVATWATNIKNANQCFDFTKTTGERSARSCLEHIYSCLQIGFRVGHTYADLRYIHIKSVKIKRNNGTYTYTQNTGDTTEGSFALTSGTNTPVDFNVPQVYIDTKNENYNKKIASPSGLILSTGAGTIVYPDGTGMDTYTQGKSLNGTDSSKEAGEKPFLTWGRVLFAPNLYTGITNQSDGFNLEIVYDVYTLHGQKTRYNVTQTMNVKRNLFMDPNNKSNPISAFAAGSYYNLLIDINPDYLYVLADDDITGHLVIKVSP